MIGSARVRPRPDGESRQPEPEPRWRRWYVWGLTSGAALFCFGPSLVGARTLVSVNLLTQYYPWRSIRTDATGHEFCSTDTIDSSIPGIQHARNQLVHGHLANWQNIVAGGSPLLSVPDLALLNPLSLPYLFLPLWLAPAFVTLLVWVVSIGGTYLFLRQFSLSRAASGLGGFIFATSGFMVMWTNWPQTRVAALIPALFWATERLLRRGRPRDAVLIGVVVASMLLGGFPQVTGFGLYLAGGYFMVRLLMEHRRHIRAAARVATLAVTGLVLGGLISAVQMLPFLRWYQETSLGYRGGISKAGLPVSGLMTLIAPNANGLCIVGRPVHGAFNPVELVAYVGAGALVLAVAGAAYLERRRRPDRSVTRAFLVVAVVAILLLGWLSPSARGLVSSLPIFNGNFIGRIRSVLGFALAALAAFGFDRVTQESDRSLSDPAQAAGPVWRRVDLLWPAVLWVAAAVAGVLVLRSAHRAALVGHYWHDLEHAIVIPLALVAAALLLVAGSLILRRLGRSAAFVVLPILIVAQGTQFFHTVLPGDEVKDFYPKTGDHQFLESHLGHDRFASAGLSLYPSTALYYGLRSPTGHAFTSPAWKDLLQKVDPKVMMSPTNSDFSASLNQANVAHQPILDLMGVRYAVLPPGDLTGAAQALPAIAGSESSSSIPLTCVVPGGPLRGLTVQLAGPVAAATSSHDATVRVRVVSGGQAFTGGVDLGPGAPAGSALTIPIAAEDVSSPDPLRATFSVTGAHGPLVLAAGKTGVACAPVRPVPDGLKLVYADPGAVIYERLSALPRIRWASTGLIMTNPRSQVSALAAGIPATEVVLDQAAPAASGRGASVTVTSDSGDDIAARVIAAGSGYLVVADAMQLPGWSVSVDGRAARLIPADHALVAVYVPAGTHQVHFVYRAPGQVTGAFLTLIGLVAAAALLWWDRRSARRTRAASAAPVEPADGLLRAGHHSRMTQMGGPPLESTADEGRT